MIDTKALRSRILDLAIQGKISSPCIDDDNVDDIAKSIPEISAKRKSLLKKSYNYDVKFDIPKHWRMMKLGQISSYGDTPKKAMISETTPDTWILELEDIQSGGALLYKKRVNSSTSIGEKTVFKKNQVLYSKLRPYLKKVLVADENGISTPELISFDVYGGIVEKYIVFYLTNSFVDKMINNRSYGVKMPRVDAGFMVNLPIPVPPLAEQKRIVQRVEEIFRILDTIDEAQEKYSADAASLRSKLITAGIQGKLTQQLPSDGTAEELYQQIQEEKNKILFERKGRKDNSIKPLDENVPFEIPNNWKWIRFGETGFFRKGPFGSSLTKSMFVHKSENTIKVYEQQHAIKKDYSLGKYYITKEYFDSTMRGFEVVTGDIIISCAGTIGETYIMPNNIEKGIINQALMRVTVVPSIDKQFFLYYFNANLKKNAKEESNGSAITNIPPFDVLKNWYFPLPPLAEQKRIAEKLGELLGALE